MNSPRNLDRLIINDSELGPGYLIFVQLCRRAENTVCDRSGSGLDSCGLLL